MEEKSIELHRAFVAGLGGDTALVEVEKMQVAAARWDERGDSHFAEVVRSNAARLLAAYQKKEGEE